MSTSPQTCHAPETAEAAAPRECTVALIGRPNSGKSSLYNQLTGGNARVGNYPGITVDVLEAQVTLPSGAEATIADLPGLYSVTATVAQDTDEAVARSFLERLRANTDRFVVAQVIDPTRLALGLRLTRELVAAELPIVLVLTHKDVLTAEGRDVDVARLGEALGLPAILVDARDVGARDALLAALDDRLRDREPAPPRASFDPSTLAREVTRDVSSSKEIQARRRATERLDAVLLHPVLGPFLFVALMALLFAAVFLVADPVTGVFDTLNGIARAGLNRVLGTGLLASLLADGVLAGAGTVLAFMPQIVILTVALELLEASGYLARGAFLVDRLLRVLGLSGRSFLPLLMGHACAIPAISSTRIIRDPRERLTTILVLPLMTCSARLPTYALVLSTFFSGRSALFRACLFVGLYFSGIVAALVVSWVLRRTATKGKGLPLVLEMPSYRVPQARVVFRKGWLAAKRFLRDVGTVIVAVSIVLWMLLTVPMPGRSGAPPDAPAIESSVAATIGRALEPVTRPAGFDWRIDVGLIGSFGARELMVATMGVVYGVEDAAEDAAPLATKLREAKRPDGSDRPRAPRLLRPRLPVHEHGGSDPAGDRELALAPVRGGLHLRAGLRCRGPRLPARGGAGVLMIREEAAQTSPGPGLRLQIVLALAGVILVAYLPLFFAIAQVTRATSLTYREDAARDLGRAVAAHVADARLADPAGLERTIGLHVGEGGALAVAVHGPDGAVVASGGSRAELASLRAPNRPYAEAARRVMAPSGRALDVVRPLGDDHAVLVRVHVDDDPARTSRLVRGIALYMTVFALALLVFAYISLTRAIVRPIEQLARAADRVASGARDLDLPASGAREVAELGSSVRAMTARLLAEEQALRAKVDELTTTTRRLGETREQLAGSEHMASVGRLAAGVAHEIGNPIAAIMGMHDLIDDAETSDEIRADFLRRMRKETERIHVVVRDLLDYARPEAGAASGRPVVASVTEVVDDALALVRPQRDFKAVTTEASVEPGLWVAIGPQRLTQVLLNVLLNAGAALASSSGDRKVVVRAKSKDAATVRIEVEDDGPGVPPDLRQRIFDPFVTTKDVGAGTGLGLAVCRGIVEGAGGRIFVDPEHTGGARFVIELPSGVPGS